MKKEKDLKEKVLASLNAIISLWSQMTDEQKLEKVKQFRTEIEENYKK
tara:strand:- start:476 stop:619 length:144 start_codon:yes stop_codon:yes gene_type:complete